MNFYKSKPNEGDPQLLPIKDQIDALRYDLLLTFIEGPMFDNVAIDNEIRKTVEKTAIKSNEPVDKVQNYRTLVTKSTAEKSSLAELIRLIESQIPNVSDLKIAESKFEECISDIIESRAITASKFF